MTEANHLLRGHNMGWLRMKHRWPNILIYDAMIFNLCHANCTNVSSIRCRSMSTTKEARDKATKSLNGYPSIYTMCWWRRKIAYFGACVVVPNRIENRHNSSYKKSHKNARTERNGTELTWKVRKIQFSSWKSNSMYTMSLFIIKCESWSGHVVK